MRSITVPTTAAAMARFDFDRASPDELIVFELNEQQFNQLWKSGVLDQLSAALTKLIDDKEYEEIKTPAELREARRIVERHIFEEGESEVLIALLKQLENAIERGTGVFFYF